MIRSLKSLSEQSNIETTVNIEEVIRYFVVHNFLCNGDSYTGQMVHNYYLYEKEGQLPMIPWEYNLAFGSFQGMNASSSVNSAIDTPVLGDMSDRPMIVWIFDNKEYTEQYHELFSKFISETDFEALINETSALIDEYVKKDPTKFCTYEDYQTGVAAIAKFCELRSESVTGQLGRIIPSTTDGQKADSSALIDASSLDISDMGTMNMGMGGSFGGFGGNNDGNRIKPNAANTSNIQMPNGGNMPPDFNGEMPEGFDPSGMFGREMPEGFDPSQMTGDKISEGLTSPENQNKESNISEPTAPQNKESDTTGQSVSQNNRPNMNGFPPMNENTSTKSNAVSYILICISVLILFSAIGFALKFKR